jgi:RNA polymerase sigma-70 factor, ECF subfamily
VDVEQHLEAVYREHGAKVYAYALRRSDRDTAQDVLSEVFLVACRRTDELPAEPLPWLLGVAHRALANARRGQARRQALNERIVAEPAAFASSQEDGADGTVLRALASLSEGDREALMLVGWEDLTNEEAAAVLGIRTATFAVRLHRAKRRLERELRQAEAAASEPARSTHASTEVV